MSDLFRNEEQPARRTASTSAPLAERVRPQRVEDFVGQPHLLGEGKPIRVMIEQDELASMIFWGPPGTGKTTLAKILSKKLKLLKFTGSRE